MKDYQEIKVAPVPKPRMTRSDVWKQRPAVMRYRQFKDDLRNAGLTDLQPILDVIFYVPMPKSWSNKKMAEMNGKPHQQKPDIDNYTKALLDAVCVEDSYIYDIRARKFWSYTGFIELRQQNEYNESEKEQL